MLRNPYYSKDTMNLNQLARDLSNQGFKCVFSENNDYISVYYLCYLDYAVISLTKYKDWLVTYCKPFDGMKTYKAATNWSVIKLLNKLMIDA